MPLRAQKTHRLAPAQGRDSSGADLAVREGERAARKSRQPARHLRQLHLQLPLHVRQPVEVQPLQGFQHHRYRKHTRGSCSRSSAFASLAAKVQVSQGVATDIGLVASVSMLLTCRNHARGNYEHALNYKAFDR